MTAYGLWRDRDGSTVVEFALIAPVLMLMLVGILDVGHTAYTTAALQGVVQKAGRDSAIQSSNAATIDAKVYDQVRDLTNTMTAPVISRRFFRDYSAASIKQHEQYNDLNANSRCDNNETYTDKNWNGVWDADGGDAGQGGAQDRTVYAVTISYPRMLPLHGFINVPPNVTLTASTVYANQPFDQQAQYAATPPTRNCS
ncbi:TadE family protein [uncultured Sphingomonas sp.]|uniref:TadE family protein n=1 Tax=uncultured Sphingomonas sp. TaxID=158754 RepID=UPI0035C95DE6